MKSRLFFQYALYALGLSRALAQGTGQPQTLPEVALHIDKAVLQTEIASNEQQREIGLMYVKKLPDNEGMVFIMPQVEQASFWMKNTLIPLSIAFIDANGVIIDIHDMATVDPTLPDRDLPVTRSDTGRTAYALETNLHWFSLNGIKPGDKLLPPPSAWPKAQP